MLQARGIGPDRIGLIVSNMAAAAVAAVAAAAAADDD